MAELLEFNRKPDFEGVAKAWEMVKGSDASKDQQEGDIKSYVVRGPYHPWWSWWMVAVVHLRPIEGVKPAKKQYPKAEYEFMILSVNPEGNQPDPDKTFPQEISYLTPPDCVVQFHGVTDEQAADICRMAVSAISKGQSCDSDFRYWWTEAIKNSVKHVRGEPH